MAEFAMVLTDTVTIDMNVLDSIVEVTKTVIGMFSVFPLNFFLTASIATLAIGFFSQLKHS